MFTAAGLPVVASGIAGLMGPGAADALASFSLLSHFEAAQRGVLELRALVLLSRLHRAVAVAECDLGQRAEGRVMRRAITTHSRKPRRRR